MSTAQPGPGPSTGDSIFVDPYEPEFPSDDGEPMAESTLQYQWIVTIKEGIAALFADRDDVFVAADLLWYATQHDKYDVVAPDVLVVFGRPRGTAGRTASGSRPAWSPRSCSRSTRPATPPPR